MPKGFIAHPALLVLRDSIVAKNPTPSFHWKEKREKLLTEYALRKEEAFVVASDITFSSPSTAAMFCLGRSANGWDEWKDQDGRTLDAIYRRQLE